MAKTEFLSAEISIEDKASKQLDRIIDSIEKQTVELLKMQKAGETSGKEMDKMTKSIIQQNNQILKLKATLDKTRSSAQKRMKVNVDTLSAKKNVDRLGRSFDILRSAASKAESVIGRVRYGLSKLNPLNLRNLLIGIGGAYAGKKVFDNTFGAAAEFEMSEKMIQAMFNDRKKAEQYINAMQNMAINSPLLNSQDIFSNSKSYISLTKNMDLLNKMWDLTERLLAVDPAQGVEGAVLALKELFSGDSQSLVERFEMPRKALNDIKKLPIDQQVKALDKLFNKMGMTKKLVNEMGSTTLGFWNQIKETSQVALRRVGQPAVDIIRPYLKEVNRAMQGGKLNRFVKFGQTMAKGIANGFVRTSKSVGKWIDSIINDPQFQKLDTISAKFQFVLDDVKKKFDNWYKNDGKIAIYNITTGIVQTIVTVINDNIGTVATVGIKLGSSLAAGIVQGISSNPVISVLAGAGIGGMIGGPIGALIGGVAGVGVGAGGMINRWLDKRDQKESKRLKDLTDLYTKGGGLGGKNAQLKANRHAIGLPRVPYDNYPALLHEGEKVLTKQQANQSERKKASRPVLITGNTFNVRHESDIKKVALELARLLESEGGLMA
jgi:hypothetical protein